MSPAGFPHSDILGSTSARDAPGLNAACHVLHLLFAPRHPPRALCSLTPSQPLTRRSGAGGIDRVLLDTTKSSISSIVTDVVTYPVVKVRSPGGDPAAATLGSGPVPAIRWSVGSGGAHGSGDPRSSGLRTRDDGSRTSLRTVVRCAELATRRSSRDSTRVIRLSSVDLAQVFVLRPGRTRSGGDEETRTPDPLLAKEMLCQLSYVPFGATVVRGWWAFLDSNQRPLPYQGSALTS